MSSFFLLIALLWFKSDIVDIWHFESCTHKVAGDFSLKAGDTLWEDVSISGGNAFIEGVIKGDLVVMGGSVTLQGKIDGDVVVLGGALENYGTITGDGAVAGGSVKNCGRIEGDIAVAGGTVELDSGSVIEGDIAVIGGSVERSDYAIVKGEIKALDIGRLDKVMPKLSRLLKGRKGVRTFYTGFLVGSLAALAVCYILSLLSLLIFPRAIERIGMRIKKDIWIGIALGIGAEILFIPLILLFVISIIGIPIIPAFLIAFFMAFIFGLTAFAQVMGERLVQGLNWQVSNKIGLFTIGYLATVLVLLIGIILKNTGFVGILIWLLGITIFYVASTIGLGSVLYALIKRRE
ncbi:MAG: hypothetical protein ABIL39_00865 [candidate division WOR-3 bacterium]